MFVLSGILSANQVVDDIRVSHTLLDGLSIPEVKFLGLMLPYVFLSPPKVCSSLYHKVNSSQVPGNLQVALCHLLPEWNNDLTSLPC